jgi:hypothetical protein
MSIAVTPSWIEEQRRYLATVSVEAAKHIPLEDRAIAALTESLERSRRFLLAADESEAIEEIWKVLCDSIRTFANLQHAHRRTVVKSFGVLWLYRRMRAMLNEANTLLERCTELARTVLLSRPELNLALPEDLEEIVWTVRISPLAHLRAMWNLFWSAVRHPLSETTIDLSTGRVLYRA